MTNSVLLDTEAEQDMIDTLYRLGLVDEVERLRYALSFLKRYERGIGLE